MYKGIFVDNWKSAFSLKIFAFIKNKLKFSRGLFGINIKLVDLASDLTLSRKKYKYGSITI
jgi:hypothetical protein